ncbi:hypothetical protein KVR01_011099 [Diaporthe batatas]|uniref:uncharacterized protein n=1 Tax=Diaporthe batatas TaxID=748121 RepID=UPI001D056174|nr:uncharacterized protein KVR01_011099 [Diaporthe batatas]KAG8159438.1 hypothetical protein KVR01_011099 [Diaporthe batatas]
MPIGDLLASIEGKPSVPSSIARARAGNGVPAKRKADDDARPSDQKQPRLAPNANGSARPNVDAPKASRPTERPSSGYTGSARPSTAAATNNNKPKPLTEKPASAASKKPSSTAGAKPSPTTPTFSTASRPATSTNSSLSRPAPVSKPIRDGAAAGSAAKAPKKGSYAEIKARAAAQAQKLKTIGKIQHRAVEKQPTKKEQDLDDARLVKKGVRPGSKPVSAAPSRDGTHSNGNGLPDRSSKWPGQKSVTGKAGSRGAAAVEERKPKKAALATTGYSGSARPAPSKAKPGAAGNGRDRARPPNPLGMFSRPRRKDDEYDEDMDDFIDDDEDEPEDEGYGRQYRYADEDDDSDMEAGYSDVEDEEEAAARLARLEDQREEAILEQRRREKEARKRAAAGR